LAGLDPNATVAIEPAESGVAAVLDSKPVQIARLDAWINFVYLSAWSYLLYGLGNATPYLRADLRLSDFEAGLHASALAVGVLAAGLTVDAVARRFGSRWLLDLGVVGLAVGATFVALAPVFLVSLTGAMFLGLAGGTLGTQVNVNLSRSDSATSRKLLNQANALSMVTAGAAAVVMGVAIQTVHDWRIALFVPIVAAVTLSLVRPRRQEERSSVRLPRASLPAAYWFVWIFLVVAVSIEFSFVFWGSTIIARQTGVPNGDATLLASLFVAGMLVARTLLGRGLGAARNPRMVLTGGLLIVLVGAGIVWISRVPALSGLGLFVGGAGTAGLFPIGMAVAFDRAGKAKYEASARGTLASGMAVLVAPSALGLASDAVGVSTAWPIILLLAVAGLVVLAATPPTD
jgi:predicted MFS family arabinose efflux permease